MAGEKAKSTMTGGKKSTKLSPKGQVHRMHIRRAHNGGFIVENHHKGDIDSPEASGTTESAISDMGQLQQHVQNNMGDQPSIPAPDPTAVAPAQPAAQAQPSM